MPKIALVVNEPPPYRIPVFNRIAATPGISLRVIFCCRREPNRHWDLPPIAFEAVYLRERITTVRGRYIHNNPDVMSALNRFRPDVVVGNGFNPTHLYARGWCTLRRRPYVPMTDGTLRSERSLSVIHRLARRIVYRGSRSFIAAADGGIRLYQSYGVPADACFLSCLCIDNQRFAPTPADRKAYDFIFCGRLEAVKAPLFALAVAEETARRLRRKTRLLVVGSGSLDAAMRQAAAAAGERVDTVFHGFATQAALPDLYRSARLFLFPTHYDPWGVVANEACAAGLPVLVSPPAGVAGELVVDGSNGHVLPMQAQDWADCAAALITDPERYRRFSQNSLRQVAGYTFDQAAQGIIDACRHALIPATPRTSLGRTT